MRRSFGSGGMGGGNGTGESGIIRTVHRAVRTGVNSATPEQFSTNSDKKKKLHPNMAFTLSSSSSVGGAFSSLINIPVVSASSVSDDLVEWECVENDNGGSDDDMTRNFYEDFVFGNVPDIEEVNHAVFALQKVLGNEVTSPTSVNKSVESEMDWIEPSLHLCNSNVLQSRGSERVYDAFHLLQTDPSVQRMVISLSSDKAVWDAVLNNEFVKELRDSNRADEEEEEREMPYESDGNGNPVKDIMSWIIVNAREKIMKLIDNIAKVVNEAFQPGNEEKNGSKSDLFEEKLKTCLFLSIVVLLIVVFTRAQSA